MFKTVKEEVSDLYIEKKSKFIAYLFPVMNKTQIQEHLQTIKSSHFEATHHCYAYILKDEGQLIYKSNDDGEPSSTAGAPILNVLKKNELENCLGIVVRYFGGIKLGAGGLTRAYTNAIANAMGKARIVTYQTAYVYELTFAYEKKKEVESYLEKYPLKIIKKEYDLKIKYDLLSTSLEIFEQLKQRISFLNVNLCFLNETICIDENSKN